MSGLKELKLQLRKVLRTKPRLYQAKGIQFLEKRNGKGLIGDDMGVGKTLEVLGYLALHPELRPAIIVCPSNAKYEWEEQTHQHTKYLKCCVLESRTPYTPENTDILIINYEILHYWEAFLSILRPKVVVVDECHYIKERKTLRTLSVKKLARKATAFIPMSGTPIINRPVEFFPVLNLLSYKNFGSFWKFTLKYCDPKRGFRGRGWDFTGASNTEDLHKRIKHLMIRRTKEEVLPELPKKQRITIPVELSNRKEYNKAHTDFMEWYEKNFGSKKAKKAKNAVGFVRMEKLRHLAAQGKMKEAFNWIDDFFHITDEKLVVFCHHRDIFKQLVLKYKKIASVGGKSGRERKEEIRRFQKNNKIRLFIGGSGDREATTLTAASTVLFIEMALTPGQNDQGEDRVLRIGQKADSVCAYYLLAHDSIDDTIWKMVEYKRDVVTRTIDGDKKSKTKIQDKNMNLEDFFKNLNQKKEKRNAN